MPILPVSDVHGDIIRFQRDLYRALLNVGIPHATLQFMSVRKALLRYYGSPEEVDAHLGDGTYRGVQQRFGGRSSWRKHWTRVRQEQRAHYFAQLRALDALANALDQCKALEVSNKTMLSKVQTHIGLRFPWVPKSRQPDHGRSLAVLESPGADCVEI